MGVLGRIVDYINPPVERTDESDIALASELAWQSQISDFWANTRGFGFSPSMIDRIWVANTCIDLTSAAISRMPLRYHGAGRAPSWVANPDPAWFPNGIGDAVYAGIDSMLRWGDAFIIVTSRYASGFAQSWTLADASQMNVEIRNGRRQYRFGQVPLNPDDVVQVSRDPRGGLKGKSALSAYSSQVYGLLGAADLGRVMMAEGAVPNAVLKSKRKLTPEQAEALQTAWVNRTAVRRGAPAVLPPDIDFEQLAFSPNDLLLLDAQKFNSQVIAAAFGVPAQFVNLSIEGGLNYQSPSMLLDQWWRTKLRPLAYTLSQALSANFLGAGSQVAFDAREFIAPTFTELAGVLEKLATDGLVTPELLSAALFGLRPGEDATEQFLTPPSAGASPAQQPSTVVELRPATTA